MKTIFSKVRLSRKQIAGLTVLILLSAIGQMMLPSLLAQMINGGVAVGSPSAIRVLAVIMVAITVCSCLINLASVRVASAISTDFAAKLRGVVFDRVQTFSSAEMDKFGTASLVTRQHLGHHQCTELSHPAAACGDAGADDGHCRLVFSLSHWRQGEFGACHRHSVLLAALSIIVVLASRYSIRLRQKLDQINRLFLESLEGVRVIRAFNKQKAESDRFDSANADFAGTAMAAGRITSLLIPAINVIFGVTTAAVLGLGAHYAETGVMEVGSLVANSQYISMVLTSVIMLSMVIMMFPTSYACAARIAEVLETETSIRDGVYPFEQRPLRSTLEFRHVTFAYPGAQEPILKDISFVSRPGEVTAIIGALGAENPAS